ncbi:ABC transporter permease subunit [Paralimibaculum aggregatum]|uniref:ABC transporter permease subunit n=1 Tax=Paralimibaculum aggregatum TaxID=3036245 RepID=A0ABQ6LBJ3_9RHOB|nr:ABC transporter permease subunit [Limibaculum sp. NKW23]GMG80794.1 ABC transporter permease subunit [Limibaculum sp. NKW23]
MGQGRARGMGWGRRLTIAVPYLWLLLFFLLPFFIVAKISISEPAIARPPYLPVWDSIGAALDHLSAPNLENYAFLFSDALYIDSYLNSLQVAGISTLLTLLVGFPMAYGMARSGPTWRAILLTAVILPFWTSFLIRVYSWIGILKTEGLLNQVLLSLGAITEPLVIHLTPLAVYIGIVYSYLPFMVLPLYSSLEKLDGSLMEAAADLGARPATVFWRVVVPLAMPGVAAGCFLVFIPAVGEFVIPELLGGVSTQMIGRTLWTEFFQNRDWPVASALTVLLVLVLVVPIVIFQRIARRGGTG